MEKFEHITLSSTDGEPLEALRYRHKKPGGLFIFLPCMMGNVRAYRFAPRYFEKASFSALLVNPRGHGNSQGQYEPQKNIQDIEALIEEENSVGLPLIMAGHSGGGAAMTMLSEKMEPKELILFSPIIDSVESLRYMYEVGSIEEFWAMLKHPEKEINELRSPDWLNVEVWQHARIREKLRYSIEEKNYRIPDVGKFLEDCFLPGFNISDALGHKKNTRVFLPKHDLWFDNRITQRLAKEAHPEIPVNIVEAAEDHFFRGHWSRIWKSIFLDEG